MLLSLGLAPPPGAGACHPLVARATAAFGGGPAPRRPRAAGGTAQRDPDPRGADEDDGDGDGQGPRPGAKEASYGAPAGLKESHQQFAQTDWDPHCSKETAMRTNAAAPCIDIGEVPYSFNIYD